MRRQSVSSQGTGNQSSILDDIGGFFSKLWHGITSFFSSLFGGDKSNAAGSPASSDDDSQADNTPASSRQTSARRPRRDRRQDFSRAANTNMNGSMYPGANGMSFAAASSGSYFSQVSPVSARFNGNSFGFRESFAPAFAGHHGGGMSFHGGGGMHCHGGGRRR
jgi:hypothetical protein